MSLRFLLVPLLALVVIPPSPATTGSVCINRFGPDPPAPCPVGPAAPDEAVQRLVPEFRWESTKFEVRIDDRAPVEVSCFQSASVSELPLGMRHAVRISVGGRQLESFFFRFEELGASRLCLSFGSYYATWQLDAVRPGTDKPCHCRSSREP
jgi:hypothetical protein